MVFFSGPREGCDTRSSLWWHTSGEKGETTIEKPRRANARNRTPDNQHVGVLGGAAQSRAEFEY
jgi:hypothetical protein